MGDKHQIRAVFCGIIERAFLPVQVILLVELKDFI